MDKGNAETRKKLKQITTVREFGGILEQMMLSEEEKQILWKHYKDKKPLSCIADELGMSEASVKKKHQKLLTKIGKMF